MVVVCRQEQHIGIDGDELFLAHGLPVPDARLRAPVDDARILAGIVKRAAAATVCAHERDQHDGFLFAIGNLRCLLRDGGELVVHFLDELFAARGFADGLCDEADSRLDLFEVPRALADDDGDAEVAERRDARDVAPVRHDDEVRLHSRNLLDRWIRDAPFDFFRERHDVRAHRVVEQTVDGHHMIGRDESEHDLVRAHRERQDAMRLFWQRDDRSLHVRDLIGRPSRVCLWR